MNLYRFIQMVLKDQRLKRPGWGGNSREEVEISKRSSNKLGVYSRDDGHFNCFAMGGIR